MSDSKMVLVRRDDLANVRGIHDDCGYEDCDAFWCLSRRRLRAALAADQVEDVADTLAHVYDGGSGLPRIEADYHAARAVLGAK